jgi:hypothetical protein
MDMLYEPFFEAVKDGAAVLHAQNHHGDGKNYCDVCFKTMVPVLRAVGVPELIRRVEYAQRGWSPGQVERALARPDMIHNPYGEEEA